MPHIIAYHPDVTVTLSDGEVVTISGDLPDWVDDDEFISVLKSGLGTKSIDDVVDRIRAGRRVEGVGNLRVR